MSAKGLGAGLGALLGGDVDVRVEKAVTTLPLEKIEPRRDQPRQTFDETGLLELAESIREHGVIQPLTVRPAADGFYQIVAGERRWRASRMAGLREVPVRIMEADDLKAAQLALVENLQREDLNPVEEAMGYRSLRENFGLTQENIAKNVGKSRPYITNSMRLLSLPEDVLGYVARGELSISHARLLLETDDEEIQRKAAQACVADGLTVRGLQTLIARLTKPRQKRPAGRISGDGVDYVAEVERELTRSMGRRVRISDGKKKGKIEIEYYGADDFEAIRKALLALGGAGGKP